MQKTQQVGIDNYNAEQVKKMKSLDNLLNQYNDGRKKTLFCVAVNLLELDELTAIIEQAELRTQGMPVKEKSAFISSLFQRVQQKKASS